MVGEKVGLELIFVTFVLSPPIYLPPKVEFFRHVPINGSLHLFHVRQKKGYHLFRKTYVGIIE